MALPWYYVAEMDSFGSYRRRYWGFISKLRLSCLTKLAKKGLNAKGWMLEMPQLADDKLVLGIKAVSV